MSRSKPFNDDLGTHQCSESTFEKTLGVAHAEVILKNDGAPDGGRQAWLVAVGGMSIFFCCLGFANSFGTFEEYYLTHQLQDQSPDKVAWIGSLQTFLSLAAGAIGGPLFDRYGAWIIRPAAITYVFAVMMLSLCTQLWQIILVQSVLMGIAIGFLQFPAFAAVSQFFDKRRAAAMGTVVSGSSIGGIVLPITLSKMLNGASLGFEWSIRIIGFLMMPLMAFSCIVIRARLPPRKTNFWIPTAYKGTGFQLLILAVFCLLLGTFTPIFFLPTYAVSVRNMQPTLAGYLLAILNAASTFGRIIPGILGDKYGRLNALAFGGVGTGLIVCFMYKTESTAGLMVYSVIFGFFSGTIVGGASAAFSFCSNDPRAYGTYIGMGLSVSGIAVLIGPPINGSVATEYGFYAVSMFSGVSCIIGGCTAFLTKLATAGKFFSLA